LRLNLLARQLLLFIRLSKERRSHPDIDTEKEEQMADSKLKDVKPKDLALVAATRGMIGFGAGLLLANKFGRDNRKKVGWALLISGLASTVPIAMHLFHKKDVSPAVS
jgi:hypothetical protein